MNVVMGCRDETFEERMRLVGLALKLGMILATDEIRVITELD